MADSAQIGKYQIVAELGSGGFATVYRAVDTTLGREVALKILHPELLVDKSFVERFFREARTLARLRHPNIITVHEVDSTEGRVFLAMELAASSLAQLIAAEGPRSWAAVIALLEPAAAALDYAHGRGVVHRDVKPANILLGEDGRVMLSDFGFARALGDLSVSVSVGAGILGTPSYIAPEVWDGKPAEAAADIYALACVAYALHTGNALFPGDTPLRAVAAHAAGPKLPPGWSSALLAVFNTALAREPAARYTSASAFVAALREATLLAPAPAAAPDATPLPTPSAASAAVAQTPAQAVTAREHVTQRQAPVAQDSSAQQRATGTIPVAALRRAASPVAAPSPTAPQAAPGGQAAVDAAPARSAVSVGRMLLAAAIGAAGWAIFGLLIQQQNSITFERLLINLSAPLLTVVALWVGGVRVSLAQFGAFAACGLLPNVILWREGYFPLSWSFSYLPIVGLLVAYCVGKGAPKLQWAIGGGVASIFILSTMLAFANVQALYELIQPQVGEKWAEVLALSLILAGQAAAALLLTFGLVAWARRTASVQ